MPDYGHELAFGTFITPLNHDATTVVGLAQSAERAGLDLVTFQDHPYQPRFFDTWTLLSFVAAKTERVKLAPSVISLPMRPPAVLARSAASLDILSGGRLELGLGAGAFWDAIEAMGGVRRTPGESVSALEEAIDIIREVWTPERGGVRVAGEHYQVVGAKRGPAPAHNMEIWIGASRPRMLRLIGRKADGWIPGGGEEFVPHLGELNKIIDDAALEAGRDPRDLRRLLNISSAEPERLAELTLQHGMTTFVLPSDDRRLIEWFGAEVAPAVRELVAKERS